MPLSPLYRRVLELSYLNRLGHIGSSLSVVDILDEIYKVRGKDEPVILSHGHAALGLYVVLEKHEGRDAGDLLKRYGTHPAKAPQDGLWCTTGSLGQGVTVAVGRALAAPGRPVWCLISDGELAEGATYEALSFARRAGLENLKLYVIANGYSAYRAVPKEETCRLAFTLFPSARVDGRSPESFGIPFIHGQLAHYYILKDKDWAWVESQEVSS